MKHTFTFLFALLIAASVFSCHPLVKVTPEMVPKVTFEKSALVQDGTVAVGTAGSPVLLGQWTLTSPVELYNFSFTVVFKNANDVIVPYAHFSDMYFSLGTPQLTSAPITPKANSTVVAFGDQNAVLYIKKGSAEIQLKAVVDPSFAGQTLVAHVLLKYNWRDPNDVFQLTAVKDTVAGQTITFQ